MPTVDLDILTKVFPPEALATRKGGGGKDHTYVATHTAIRRAIDATGNCFDWKINKLEFYVDTWVCYGTVTIPGLGSRDGIGVQKVSANGGEDLIKGASSDAFKKALTMFGVALELYGPDFEDADYVGAPAPSTWPNPNQRTYPQQQRPPDRQFPSAGARPSPASNGGGDADVKPCYKCNLPVRFAQENGKQERYNADGGLHFKTCGKGGGTGYEQAGGGGNQTEDEDPFRD
jgi:hypothetical protein